MSLVPVVYHRVPENLLGETLYPLNTLRGLSLSLYEEAIEKYRGRERLMREKVYPLGCLWSDVIHLTPLHPQRTFDALAKIRPPAEPRRLRFVRIPFPILERARCCWFHPMARMGDQYQALREEEFSLVEEYRELAAVPEPQIARWHEDFRHDKPRLLWSHTPHLLYAGSISLTGLDFLEAVMG